MRSWIGRAGLTILLPCVALAQRDIIFEAPGDGGATDIFSISPAGSPPMDLTRHAAADRDARISRDGRTVAFVSDRDGNSNCI